MQDNDGNRAELEENEESLIGVDLKSWRNQ